MVQTQSALTAEIRLLEKKRATLQGDIDRLNRIRATTPHPDTGPLTIQISHLNKKRDALVGEISNVSKSLMQRRKDYSEAVVENQKIRDEVEERKAVRSALLKEIKTLRTTIDEHVVAKRIEVNIEANLKTKELDVRERTLDGLKDTLEQLEADIKRREEKLLEGKREIAERGLVIDKQERSVIQLRKRLDKKNTHLLEKEAEIKDRDAQSEASHLAASRIRADADQYGARLGKIADDAVARAKVVSDALEIKEAKLLKYAQALQERERDIWERQRQLDDREQALRRLAVEIQK